MKHLCFIKLPVSHLFEDAHDCDRQTSTSQEKRNKKVVRAGSELQMAKANSINNQQAAMTIIATKDSIFGGGKGGGVSWGCL